ncbi:MAG: helix-turn-helix transcriptional regulator [Rikenellaceae bacterium]|nr:helix-turn-helix transcriptional regulator [Rikenellaceae bacterium]
MKNNIRVERAVKRITQQTLADKCGVSRQTINAIELEKYSPSGVLIMKIAAVLDKHVEEVFTLEEEDWK